MTIQTHLRIMLAVARRLAFAAIAVVVPIEQMQAATVFAESGPFELYTLPQPAVAGRHATRLAATMVGMRTKDPTESIEGIRSLAIRGDVHQTWGEEIFFGTGSFRSTVFREDLVEFPDVDPDPFPNWGIGDTHLIPACRTTGACAVSGTIVEENDNSDPLGLTGFLRSLDGEWDDYVAVTGIGDLAMPTADDTLDFFAASRSRSVELAYIVTPADTRGRPVGTVTLALEVYGRDAAGEPLVVLGQFGLDPQEPLAVVFVPEPSSLLLVILVMLTALWRWYRAAG